MATMPDAALVEALNKAILGLNPLTAYGEDAVWRPADKARAALIAAREALLDADTEATKLRDESARLESLLTASPALSQPALPREGEWVTVPREPTEAMLVVGREALLPLVKFVSYAPLIGLWRDMLGARPIDAFLPTQPYDAPFAAPPAPDLRGEVETDADLLARGWNIAAERAQSAEAQLAEAKGEVERLNKLFTDEVAERYRQETLVGNWQENAESFSDQVATLTAQRDRLQERLEGLQMSFEAEGAARDKLQVQLNILREAGKPFKQMAEVLEARALMAFGRTVPDNERLLLSSGEVGTAAINMGHFRALRAAYETIGKAGE